VVKVCAEILRPGGLAYFVTHDVEALPAKLMGEMSPIIDVEHIYLFGKATLSRLVKESGLEVLAVRSMKNRYPLNYWLKMLFKKGFGALAGDLVRKSGLGKFAIPIAAGNIFVVARKPYPLKGNKI
jgi:hypothetical protein